MPQLLTRSVVRFESVLVCHVDAIGTPRARHKSATALRPCLELDRARSLVMSRKNRIREESSPLRSRVFLRDSSAEMAGRSHAAVRASSWKRLDMHVP
jgi:hypothetical protein